MTDAVVVVLCGLLMFGMISPITRQQGLDRVEISRDRREKFGLGTIPASGKSSDARKELATVIQHVRLLLKRVSQEDDAAQISQFPDIDRNGNFRKSASSQRIRAWIGYGNRSRNRQRI